MAVVFTLLSMLMVCGEDLYEKKAVSSRVEDALKTLVWYGIPEMNLVAFSLCWMPKEDGLS